MRCKLLLFDLDGTLLQTNKTISKINMQELEKCRKQGIMIGVSTSRSEKNSLEFIAELNPDVVISSAGALVKYRDTYIYKAEFTQAETNKLIKQAREICGEDCEITIDTVNEHYWNYKIDPKQQDKSWGDSIYTDFRDFEHASLKMCVEIFDEKVAEQLQKNLPECDCVRFSDGYWYKFTKKTATKENAILNICEICGITTEDIIAFGDDYADIGMLKLCGIGVAMGNAIDEVKAIADCVIGDNDSNAIGKYLKNVLKSLNTDFGDIEEYVPEAEIWDLYNENRELLGKDHVRGEQLPIDGYHLVVHVWIRNSKGEYLISQRSANRPTYPLMWECVGGSVVKGEDSLLGAIREVKEEVGVDLMPENGQVLFTKTRKIIEGKIFNDIMDVWLFEYDGEVDLSNATTDEVAQVAWMNREQIKELFERKMFVDTLKYFFTEVDK